MTDNKDEIGNEESEMEADFTIADTQQAKGVQEVHVQGLGKAYAELLTFGDIQKRTDQGRDQDQGKLTTRDMSFLIKKAYHQPDMSDLNQQAVEEMQPEVPGNLIEAAMGEADVETKRNQDGTLSVEMQEGK